MPIIARCHSAVLSAALGFSAMAAAPHAAAYEVCTPQNDYLESALPAYHQHLRAFDFPLACIETAESLLPLVGFYGYCADDNGQPGRTHPRPCLSANYVGSVYNAMADVSECMSYDPRWAFAVLNLESALHINAVGAATDIGIGQLTSSAINEVNLNALPRAKRIARASKLDSCKRLQPMLYDGETDIGRRCSFISLPQNPTHDLSFAVLLLKRNHELLDGFVSRWGLTVPATVNVKRVKVLLSMLGYNAGIGGVAATLRAYLKHGKAKVGESHFDFENRGPDSFVTFVAKNFPSKDEAVRLRTSKYAGFIIKSVRRIEATGLKEGMCSDPMLMHTGTHAVIESVASSYSHRPDPDAVTEVEAGMTDIAESFKTVRVNSNAECEQTKAEFRYTFAPDDVMWASLPASVLEAYKHLCAR